MEGDYFFKHDLSTNVFLGLLSLLGDYWLVSLDFVDFC